MCKGGDELSLFVSRPLNAQGPCRAAAETGVDGCLDAVPAALLARPLGVARSRTRSQRQGLSPRYKSRKAPRSKPFAASGDCGDLPGALAHASVTVAVAAAYVGGAGRRLSTCCAMLTDRGADRGDPPNPGAVAGEAAPARGCGRGCVLPRGTSANSSVPGSAHSRRSVSLLTDTSWMSSNRLGNITFSAHLRLYSKENHHPHQAIEAYHLGQGRMQAGRCCNDTEFSGAPRIPACRRAHPQQPPGRGGQLRRRAPRLRGPAGARPPAAPRLPAAALPAVPAVPLPPAAWAPCAAAAAPGPRPAGTAASAAIFMDLNKCTKKACCHGEVGKDDAKFIHQIQRRNEDTGNSELHIKAIIPES